MTGAIEKFYLRKNIDDARVQEILQHVEAHGRDKAAVEEDQQEVVLYVYDSHDTQLVKNRFPDLIDAEVDLTQ